MSVADLPGLFFLDTNIFAYSCDSSAPAKQTLARTLIRTALETRRGVVSSQVVQEFLNVARRKFEHPLSVSDSLAYLNTALAPLCKHFPSVMFYERALSLQQETGFAWYDALIVSAAIDMNCATLLTEDLQDGRSVRGMTIVNPFSPSFVPNPSA